MNSKSITFLGDIAIPSCIEPDSDSVRDHINNSIVIANIEGDLVNQDEKYYSKNVLFNHISCLNYLSELNVSIGNLANNHILDIHTSVNKTIKHLERNGITTIGAGDNLGQASQIRTFEQRETSYALLSFGWKVIGSFPADIDSPGVNPLNPEYVLSMVKYAKQMHPNRRIIVQFHWNYDLELHPQPMHRRLAFQAAECGADIIVGHHPHVVSGIEIHDSTPIIYSLGNWFIPHGIFFGGDLTYPEISLLQLALEWSPTEGIMCHWYRYHPEDHTLRYIESEPSSDSKRVEERTPYKGMSHDEYIDWFRKNRRVKSFLPIYRDPSQKRMNSMKDIYCRNRQILVDKMSMIR